MTDALGAAQVQQEHLMLDRAISRQLSAPQAVGDSGLHPPKACRQARLPEPAYAGAAIGSQAPQDTAHPQVLPHFLFKPRSCRCHIMPSAGWIALEWGGYLSFRAAAGLTSAVRGPNVP